LAPGFLASYVVLYVAGVLGARNKWLERVPAALVKPWLMVSIVALALFVTTVVITGPAADYGGGWNVRAASYAFFEPFFACGVILGLLWLFRSRLNSPTGWSSFLSARAYTVYVIHTPVLVAVTRALSFWHTRALLKVMVAGTLGCAASVAGASLILLIPGARRVL
jgi:surface polysaccharide O-acyltransferase-like enzyme